MRLVELRGLAGGSYVKVLPLPTQVSATVSLEGRDLLGLAGGVQNVGLQLFIVVADLLEVRHFQLLPRPYGGENWEETPTKRVLVGLLRGRACFHALLLSRLK